MNWTRGQLLNMRNAGAHWNITVAGEEYDPRYPERCLQIPYAGGQNFISAWYAREAPNPFAR